MDWETGLAKTEEGCCNTPVGSFPLRFWVWSGQRGWQEVKGTTSPLLLHVKAGLQGGRLSTANPLGQSLHQASEVIWGPWDTPGPCFSPEASCPSFRACRSGRETQSLQTFCVARQKLQCMVASYEKLSREKVSLLRNAPPDHPAEIIPG